MPSPEDEYLETVARIWIEHELITITCGHAHTWIEAAVGCLHNYLPRGHIVCVQRFKAGRVIALTHEDCDRLDREPFRYVKRGVGSVIEVRKPKAQRVERV